MTSAGRTDLAKFRINVKVYHEGKYYGTQKIKAGDIYDEGDATAGKPASLKRVNTLRTITARILAQHCYRLATDGKKTEIEDLIVNGAKTGDTYAKYPLPGMNDFIQIKADEATYVPNDSLEMIIEDSLDDGKASLDIEIHTQGLEGEIVVNQQPPQQQQTTQQQTTQQTTQQQQTMQQQTMQQQ